MKVDDKYKVGNYYPTIGIECHVQLRTKTKLFVSVGNDARGATPNTLVSHVCFGLPGALPYLNKEAVRLAAHAAYALGVEPQRFSKFDRKHYFYPDLPKGYQTSQFDEPIILGGNVTIHLEDGSTKKIGVTRAHLEEDAGKSTHPAGADYSLVDLNRAGTPLLEIVSEPEMHSSEEAREYAKELWLLMKFADVSNVDLHQGNMRFDVNVSVSKDPDEFGTRTETKNLNSFKSVERAVDYEIKRQIELLERGESIVQETRGWLDDSQKTVSQRSKEDAHDYRYFPDPDLPPIVFSDEDLALISTEVTKKLPEDYRQLLLRAGVDKKSIETLLVLEVQYPELEFISLVENCIDRPELVKFIVNYIVNILAALDDLHDVKHHRPTLEQYTAVFEMYSGGELSSTTAKQVLHELTSDDDPRVYAESKGYLQINDSGEMEAIVQEVINENPKPAEDVKSGEMKAIGFLVGQVMKKSGGKANPAEAQKIIRTILGV